MQILTILLACAIFGFFAAIAANKVLRGLLRFRAEWRSTFTACMLTCLIAGYALGTALVSIDHKADFAFLKIFSAAFLVALCAGFFSFRLIIKSESGRSLSWGTAAVSAFVLGTPFMVFIGVVGLMVNPGY